jgi:Family of unknown function (DUF5906)/Primase C terminal 2 (PriCT-2)
VAARLGAIYSPPAWSKIDEAEIVRALAAIPADDRETWLRIGRHWTTWGARARRLWDDWSKKCAKYDPVGQDKAWNSFGRADYNGPVATLRTLFHVAMEHGYVPHQAEPDEGEEPEQLKNLIDEINQRHFMIRNIGGKCLIGEMKQSPTGSGEMLSLVSVEAFKLWFSNRYLGICDPDGNAKRKPLGDYWIRHRRRRQYEGVDLIPNAPKELPNGNLNLWRGFGVEPKQGKWPLMFQHICHVLADGDRNAAEYILRWIAWSVQHPGELAEVALVLRGGKGSGKGIFGNALVKCFGEHALHIFQQSHLTGKFNGHFRSCLFLFADEAYWAGDKKNEGVLKGLITERSLVIEQKGIDAVQWPNRLHVLMLQMPNGLSRQATTSGDLRCSTCRIDMLKGQLRTTSVRPISMHYFGSVTAEASKQCCTTCSVGHSGHGILGRSTKRKACESKKSRAYPRSSNGLTSYCKKENCRGM